MSASKSTDTDLQGNNASSGDPKEIYIYPTKEDYYFRLVMRHMNKGGFNDLNENWTMKSALCFSHSYGKSRYDLLPENINAYMVMETLAPMIDDSRFLCAADAETVFQKHVIGMKSPTIATLERELTEEKYQDTLKIMNLIGSDNKPKYRLPANKDLSPDPAMDIDECCFYVRMIARLDDLHWANKVIELAINVLIACLKKGRFSYGYGRGITKTVAIETGNYIDVRVRPISDIWNILQHHIDDANIEDFILDLMKLIPTGARYIQVRMIFDRISETGMTVYCTIIKAIQEFPNFKWGRIFELLPEDWTKFQSAMALKPNRYYGFKHNIDEAFRSNGYKNLGWVARAMLVKYRDCRSLMNVKTFSNDHDYRSLKNVRSFSNHSMKNQIPLQTLIDEYNTDGDDEYSTDDDYVLEDRFFVHEVDIAARALGHRYLYSISR